MIECYRGTGCTHDETGHYLSFFAKKVAYAEKELWLDVRAVGVFNGWLKVEGIFEPFSAWLWNHHILPDIVSMGQVLSLHLEKGIASVEGECYNVICE